MIIRYSKKIKIFHALFSLVPRVNVIYKISLWYIRHFFGFNYGLNTSDSEHNLLVQVCKKQNAVIFDVGGNEGQWSLRTLAKLPDAKIHMFEPSSSVCSIAKKNLDKYNITINNLAVGNKDGTSKFYEYGPSEIASVHKNDDKEEKKPISVPIATIDNYCYSNNIDKIDFLKIDTEGHDFYVLKGAQNMLKKHQINYVQFEYGPSNLFSRIFLKDIFEFIQKEDYEIFRIYPSWIRPTSKYSHELENFINVNYVAIAPNLIKSVQGYIRD